MRKLNGTCHNNENDPVWRNEIMSTNGFALYTQATFDVTFFVLSFHNIILPCRRTIENKTKQKTNFSADDRHHQFIFSFYLTSMFH